MPQKKNPDVAELARGKAGRLIGNLTGLLATLKALPLAYDRDLQEDKEPVFDAVDTLLLVLPAVTGMIATMRVCTARLEAAAPAGFSLATEVADLLVRRGVPFREAHEAVGHLVAWCQANDREMTGVTAEELAHVSPHLTPDVSSVLDVRSALAAHTTAGSTGPGPVGRQLDAVVSTMDRHRTWAQQQVIPS
jgi:argininosuccinate lyase